MIIIWGSSLYGKVDEVPGGLFHVATKFGHLYYLPLFPVGTHVVLSKEGDMFHGVAISMSFKSVLMAWLRAALIVGSIVAGIYAISVFSDQRSTVGNKIGAVASAVAAIGLLIATYRFGPMRYASYKRAHEIAELIGLNERGKILLDVAYGIVTPEEAEEAMKGLEEVEASQSTPMGQVPTDAH